MNEWWNGVSLWMKMKMKMKTNVGKAIWMIQSDNDSAKTHFVYNRTVGIHRKSIQNHHDQKSTEKK